LPQNITTVTVFDIDYRSGGSRSVALQLSNILLTLPLTFNGWLSGGVTMADLRSVDVPLLGNVAVSGRDVTELPYVGLVDAISHLHSSNANIQQSPGGFVIRGSVSRERVWAGAANNWLHDQECAQVCGMVVMQRMARCWACSPHCYMYFPPTFPSSQTHIQSHLL
jgi:hypothetical protein